jgi:hypothetical protein
MLSSKPSLSYVMYEFCRQTWIGFAMTFGSRRVPAPLVRLELSDVVMGPREVESVTAKPTMLDMMG